MNRRDLLRTIGAGAVAATAAARSDRPSAAAAAEPAQNPRPERAPRPEKGPGPFFKGGDVSLLQKIEDLGDTYKEGGKVQDALAIFKRHGCNAMRLRIFHTPDGRGPVCQDLPYTVKLGRRIKAADMALILDFHYSDTWADPSHQAKPAAWRDLEPERLEAAVADYTRDVAVAMKAGGATPDIVQIGNEITPGMLWETGRVGGKSDIAAQWRQLGRLVASGIRGLRAGLTAGDAVRTRIHLDCGGNAGTTRWFFDRLAGEGVECDLIGLSYYPWWHGPIEKLRENLAATSQRYRKDIVVVEAAYPWTGPGEKDRGPGTKAGETKNSPHPPTPEGQRAFLAEVIRTVREMPDDRGRGVIWWAPEWIPAKGMGSGWGDKTLFDRDGNALPALAAFEG
jgi:arabinogalactan endo-1,4-beta-galactosidase